MNATKKAHAYIISTPGAVDSGAQHLQQVAHELERRGVRMNLAERGQLIRAIRRTGTLRLKNSVGKTLAVVVKGIYRVKRNPSARKGSRAERMRKLSAAVAKAAAGSAYNKAKRRPRKLQYIARGASLAASSQFKKMAAKLHLNPDPRNMTPEQRAKAEKRSAEFQAAASMISAAARISREYNADLKAALEAWGDKGPFISGAGRDHFPESVKERLRAKARLVGTHLEAARKALPKGTRTTTYRKLRDAIYAREGRGYYG